MAKGTMNVGGPEWLKWCGEYETATKSQRLRAERRIRRDRWAKLADDEARNAKSTYTKSV